ncbi:MAG: glycosyltransferase family 9 protein [Opitutaceae bacterium]|nr:glycosyltransferase family 9 protein [Opitutaceae bacterium]
MRRILVLRGGALGDLIVTLPALALLRARWPEARIEIAGNATAAQLARTRGLVDAVHSQHEARWSALFGAPPLPKEFATWLAAFDLIVSWWPDPDGALRRHFPQHAGQTFVCGEALPQQAPAAAHYCATLQPSGVGTENFVYRLAADAPRRHGLVIHPGSGSPRKNWPRERWLALIAELPAPVTLILGEAELERGAWPVPGSVTVLRQPPLETLVALLAVCRLFLGHDSGVSHLAAACGAPCVLLFGPTDPAVWAPPAPRVNVIRRGPTLDCIAVSDVLAAIQGSAQL